MSFSGPKERYQQVNVNGRSYLAIANSMVEVIVLNRMLVDDGKILEEQDIPLTVNGINYDVRVWIKWMHDRWAIRDVYLTRVDGRESTNNARSAIYEDMRQIIVEYIEGNDVFLMAGEWARIRHAIDRLEVESTQMKRDLSDKRQALYSARQQLEAAKVFVEGQEAS